MQRKIQLQQMEPVSAAELLERTCGSPPATLTIGTRTGDHVPPARRPPAATGQLNTATENALNSMLAGGNNQMGGNTNTNQMNANN